MITAFQKAAAFKRGTGAVKLVGVNGLGVLNEASPERYLHTEYANVCAGLALVSEDKKSSALLHIFSDDSLYRHGEDKIAGHVSHFWHETLRRVPHDTAFNAVAFGGRLSFEHQPYGIPDKDDSDFLITMEYLENEFTRIYGAHPARIYLSGKKDEEKFDAALAELGMRVSDFNLLADFLQSDARKTIRSQMSIQVSEWIGNTLFDTVMESGRIANMEDIRFKDAPHDAIIDSLTGDIFIGRSEVEKLSRKMCTEDITAGEKLIKAHHIFETAEAPAP